MLPGTSRLLYRRRVRPHRTLDRRQPAEILKAVKTGVVAIAPARLQGITTDEIKAIELKAFRTVGYRRSDDVAENVGLAAAGRARAGASKDLQVKI